MYLSILFTTLVAPPGFEPRLCGRKPHFLPLEDGVIFGERIPFYYIKFIYVMFNKDIIGSPYIDHTLAHLLKTDQPATAIKRIGLIVLLLSWNKLSTYKAIQFNGFAASASAYLLLPFSINGLLIKVSQFLVLLA